MDFRIVRTFQELETYREAIITFTSEYADSIFGTYSWFSAWLKVYAKEIEIYCYLFFKETALVSVVPLVIKIKQERLLCFAGDSLNDLNEIMCVKEYADEIHAIMLKEISQLDWDVALFLSISRNLYEVILSFIHKATGWEIAAAKPEYTPYISLPRTIAGFYAGLPASTSKKYQYVLRRLIKGTEYSFGFIRESDDRINFIEVFEANRIASWRKRNKLQELPDEIKDEKFKEFLSSIILSMTAEGSLLLPVIKKKQ